MRFLTFAALIFIGLMVSFSPADAQIDPDFMRPCELFPGDFSPALSQPWKRPGLPCLEQVIADSEAGEWAFTAMTTAPDGTMFVTRPRTGEVFALDDTDGEGLPDTPRRLAGGLNFPNGLAYHEGQLYILTADSVLRLDLEAGERVTLIDDLPGETGFITGGLEVVNDRLYFTTGARCDDCRDEERGTVVSAALDGSDQRVIARGLRHPYGLASFEGALWTGDRARDLLYSTSDMDELNRIPLSQSAAPIDFGFPFCIGAQQPDQPEAACAGTEPPYLRLPTHSAPMGLAAYTSDAIPELTGKLLIVLGGTEQQLELRGYALAAFDPHSGELEILIPANPALNDPRFMFTMDEINYRGAGFFPHRPIDVAVSHQGVVYISGGGRIISLRPYVPSARASAPQGEG